MQPLLIDTVPRFDGPDLAPADQARLAGSLARVLALMQDGRWRTLPDIAFWAQCKEQSASARLRDLRKAKFGSWTVEKRRIGNGLWAYKVTR